MDILSIALGVVLGILLAIGDHMAIRTRASNGFAAGFLVYFFMLIMPLVLAWLYAGRMIAIVGFGVGLVLSGLMVYQRYRQIACARSYAPTYGNCQNES